MDEQKYAAFVESQVIPQTIKRIVRAVAVECGMLDPFPDDSEDTIPLRNRGGWTYAYGKGFVLSYCTSSLENGPDADPRYIIDFIKGLGFTIENSYGDNGMDGSTNWHDTYWNYDFLYKPSVKQIEEFE